MTHTATYHYTPAQLSAAFNEISATLFAGIIPETRPKLLITAGVQSSGKTWLLEKTLLPSGQYNNYVRLYLPEYRSKHPQYQDMLKLGDVPHMFSLVPMAQSAASPIDLLTSKDGLSGGQYNQQGAYIKFIAALSGSLIRNLKTVKGAA